MTWIENLHQQLVKWDQTHPWWVKLQPLEVDYSPLLLGLPMLEDSVTAVAFGETFSFEIKLPARDTRFQAIFLPHSHIASNFDFPIQISRYINIYNDIKCVMIHLCFFNIIPLRINFLPSRSLTSPLKSCLPKRKLVFQPPFFRGELLNFWGVSQQFPWEIQEVLDLLSAPGLDPWSKARDCNGGCFRK